MSKPETESDRNPADEHALGKACSIIAPAGLIQEYDFDILNTKHFHLNQSSSHDGIADSPEAKSIEGYEITLTGDAHPVTELNRIPYHGPVCDGDQSFGVIVWVCRKGRKRRPRPTENEGLQAWRRH
jgi:hypothetical protein